jgi:cobalt-zinc-cadmium efflux system outer membrane protein
MALSFLLVLSLRAAEPAGPRALTVEACLARAAARSLELKAGALKTEASESRARQAARRPNPRLEAEVENVAGTGGAEGLRAAETTLTLAQELELGNKRRHRTASAKAETDVSRAAEAARRHELLCETRRACLAVLAAQEKVRLAEELLALARETETVAQAREQAGKATVLETERARTETERAALDVQERQAEQHQAVRELALIWNDTEPDFDVLAGSLGAPPGELPALDALLLQAAAHPALLAAEAQTRVLDAQLRTEQAARLPNVQVSGGLRRFEESDGYGFVAGVGVDLPLFNRNRDAVRAAETSAAAARLEEASARLKNEGALRGLYARLRALAAKDKCLRDTVVPSAERALDLVRQAHQQGKVGYLDVLEARRAVASARSSLIEATADYHARRIDLDERAAAPVPQVPQVP